MTKCRGDKKKSNQTENRDSALITHAEEEEQEEEEEEAQRSVLFHFGLSTPEHQRWLVQSPRPSVLSPCSTEVKGHCASQLSNR